jgi:hypothetical protein
VPVAAEIVGAGHTDIGVDVSPRQVGLVTRHLPHGDFRLGDIANQRFGAGVFDAVVALYVITHVPRERWASLMAKVHRWGRAACSGSICGCFHRPAMAVSSTVRSQAQRESALGIPRFYAQSVAITRGHELAAVSALGDGGEVLERREIAFQATR